MNGQFDIIIIGSGAGGGTMAHALADTGARILIVERGDFVPQEDENWNPEAVWKHLRYQTDERWVDDRGREFRPYTHYCVGGNTKFWGSVLYRLRREDFQAVEHLDGVSPAWPIDYDTLAPYYDRAERLYQVRGTARPRSDRAGARGLSRTSPCRTPKAWNASSAKLRAHGSAPIAAAARAAASGRERRLHSLQHLQFVRVQAPRKERSGRRLRPSGAAARRTSRCGPTRARGASIDQCGRHTGRRRGGGARTARTSASKRRSSSSLGRGDQFGGAAAAVRSDRHPAGLANSSGLVGKRYMAHLATMMQGFHPFRKNSTVFQKTVAVNDFYLRGGADADIRSARSSRRAGRTASWRRPSCRGSRSARTTGGSSRGVDWLVMSEDLPTASNRVTVDDRGRIHLHYTPNNLRAHRRLVRETKRILRRLGFPIVVTHSHGARNTTHQCGTLVFGTDPRTSVLDTFCRTHDVENLFVVDASFFPSSAAVNPGLTIAAQALRVADHIKASSEAGFSRPASVEVRL